MRSLLKRVDLQHLEDRAGSFSQVPTPTLHC